MEKIDVEKKFPQAKGDFIPIPASLKVDGWGEVPTKKGAVKVVRFRREDGLNVAFFADQLRQEGEALFISSAHLAKQIKRAEEWAAGKGGVPQK